MPGREYISNINPERIRWCCEEAGLSLGDFSRRIKLSVAKLKEAKLTFRQLQEVSRYFGYGIFFFLRPGPPQQEKIHSIAFRTLTGQKVQLSHTSKKLIRLIENHRDIYLGLLEDMGEERHFGKPHLEGGIKNKAEVVRRWLGIDGDKKYGFDDYRRLIEAKGILVFQSQGYKGDWQVSEGEDLVGFSMSHDAAPVIFIRKSSKPRQTFTLFHELGHLLLHEASCLDDKKNLSIDQRNEQEREANRFAGYCLIPDEAIERLDLRNYAPENYQEVLQDVTARLGVSVEAVVVALLQRKRIARKDYEEYKRVMQGLSDQLPTDQKKGKIPRTYRHREPRHIFGDNYVGAVFNALYADKITMNRASDYLGRLKIDDIKKLSEHLFTRSLKRYA